MPSVRPIHRVLVIPTRPRKEFVAQLIEGRFPLESLRAELATYPWDLDEPLVVLRPSHIESILRRYIVGELSAASVSAWADALEMRDDVGFEQAKAKTLAHALFVLANPDVNGQLTPQRAEALIVEISQRSA